MDVKMPGPSGLEVCRALKDDPETAAMIVVMLTAGAEPGDREQGLAAGADDYLTKPFSPLALAATVEKLLEARGMGSSEGEAPVTLELPEAPRDAYLRWMGYVREAERSIGERPALAALAERGAAPFSGDPVADFTSTEIVGQIVRQAEAARRAGRPSVAPRITGDRVLLARAVVYVIRRARWLQREEVAEALGVGPLDEDLANLRAKVVAVAQMQLSQQAQDRLSVRLPYPSSAGARGRARAAGGWPGPRMP